MIVFNKLNKIKKLEEKYLKVDNNCNTYGFQKKYSNQTKILYKLFGDVEEKTLYKLKCIVITDTHNTLKIDELEKIVNNHPDYDVCILLGDHTAYDIEKVLKLIDKDKIYALLGNHDSNYIDSYGLNNLNGNIIEINGVKFMGIQGSFKYKPSDFPSFSQEESVLFLKDKDKVDILFSHDGPYDDSKKFNPAHQGLFGINYYLFKNHVKYNIHGHLHNSFNKNLENGTKEICVYGINYLEIN